MKKLIALLLALMMCVAVFAACGGEDEEDGADANNDGASKTEEVKDSTYDVGQFTVTVPGGWMAIPVKDAFGADPSANKTDTIRICKGAESEWDLNSKPYAEVIFWDETQGVMPGSSAYKNIVEIEGVVTGEHTWGGFSCETNMGKKLTILWEDTGDLQYQVNMWTEGDDSSISLEDEDVKKLLASIKPVASDAGTEVSK